VVSLRTNGLPVTIDAPSPAQQLKHATAHGAATAPPAASITRNEAHFSNFATSGQDKPVPSLLRHTASRGGPSFPPAKDATRKDLSRKRVPRPGTWETPGFCKHFPNRAFILAVDA